MARILPAAKPRKRPGNRQFRWNSPRPSGDSEGSDRPRSPDRNSGDSVDLRARAAENLAAGSCAEAPFDERPAPGVVSGGRCGGGSGHAFYLGTFKTKPARVRPTDPG